MLSYAARIKKEADGYLVTFEDFDNVMTYGLTIEEALVNAEEALNGCLESDFERNFKIPQPSRVSGKNVYQIPVAPHVAVAIMLRALRADRSQLEIAKQLNIAYQVYQRLENPRKANPTIKTLEKSEGIRQTCRPRLRLRVPSSFSYFRMSSATTWSRPATTRLSLS